MTLKTLVAAACLSLASASASLAATYDFNWNSTGSTPSVAGTTAVITGTFDVSAGPGETFTGSDVTNLDFTWALTGSVTAAGTFDTARPYFDGTIDIWGGLAFTDFGVFVDLGPNTVNAECAFGDCALGEVVIVSPSDEFRFVFTGQAAAQDSFNATLVPAVPLPAGGLLLLSGFGAIAALKRRKKRAA